MKSCIEKKGEGYNEEIFGTDYEGYSINVCGDCGSRNIQD